MYTHNGFLFVVCYLYKYVNTRWFLVGRLVPMLVCLHMVVLCWSFGTYTSISIITSIIICIHTMVPCWSFGTYVGSLLVVCYIYKYLYTRSFSVGRLVHM